MKLRLRRTFLLCVLVQGFMLEVGYADTNDQKMRQALEYASATSYDMHSLVIDGTKYHLAGFKEDDGEKYLRLEKGSFASIIPQSSLTINCSKEGRNIIFDINDGNSFPVGEFKPPYDFVASVGSELIHIDVLGVVSLAESFMFIGKRSFDETSIETFIGSILSSSSDIVTIKDRKSGAYHELPIDKLSEAPFRKFLETCYADS